MAAPPATEPKKNRAIRTVRILTWLAVTLFLVVLAIMPRGITVFWNVYFILFGPVILVDASALFAFVFCSQRGHRVSHAYAFMSLAVIREFGTLLGLNLDSDGKRRAS